jgi:hypothetical protein
MYVIIFYVIKQYIKNLKDGKFLIKNSGSAGLRRPLIRVAEPEEGRALAPPSPPIDKLGSFLKMVGITVKTISKATIGTGIV